MNSPQFIRAKLVSRTNADCSSKKVKNNRIHYFLRFEEPIGWDWLFRQVRKASEDTDTSIELYKILPSGVNDFEVEVREVDRRSDIDDSQIALDSYSGG